MNKLPINESTLDKCLHSLGLKALSESSIREVVAVIKLLEQETGIDFIRMDMGVPGIPAPDIALQAEHEALNKGLPAEYAQIDGIPRLKTAMSQFAKKFLDIDVSPRSCLVTAGSMMGAMIAFMVASKREISRQGILFIDPGFPVQKKQAMVLNLPVFSLDIYEHRGAKLYDKLEELCAKNGISTIIYSNPNNPTWVCLTQKELKAIGEIADKHDIIILEDLAYFGMDFRQNYGIPGKAPYQPSIAKYTDNYLILFSSSKIFSYAGQRVGGMLVSDALFNRTYPELLKIGDNDQLGPALIQDGVYIVTAGASHTAQHGLAGVLEAVNRGELAFLDRVKVYGEKAHQMKEIFQDAGFQILYDRDGDAAIADGFYFTLTYPGLTAEGLIRRFILCGLGAVSLSIMGCKGKAGVRISSSKIAKAELPLLEERLKYFNNVE